MHLIMKTLRTLLTVIVGAVTLSALPAPEDPTACAALGLPSDCAEFDLKQLKGERIVLLMFDLYCPVCQKSVSNFNRLTKALAEDHPNVTVLGIGCGDTAFETARFVKKFKLGVTAVPDRERSLGQRFSLSKTPSVMLLKRGDDDQLAPLYQHSGYFGRPQVDALLATLANTES